MVRKISAHLLLHAQLAGIGAGLPLTIPHSSAATVLLLRVLHMCISLAYGVDATSKALREEYRWLSAATQWDVCLHDRGSTSHLQRRVVVFELCDLCLSLQPQLQQLVRYTAQLRSHCIAQLKDDNSELQVRSAATVVQTDIPLCSGTQPPVLLTTHLAGHGGALGELCWLHQPRMQVICTCATHAAEAQSPPMNVVS